MNLKLIFPVLLVGFSAAAQDADSLLTTLGSKDTLPGKVSSSFKSTRIVLTHSTETQKKYDLDLRIRHHFGDIGGEFGDSHTLYGLDVASDLSIAFDYGITNDLTLGLGRSKYNELYNLFLKQKLFKQSVTVPFAATILAQAAWITRKARSAGEFINNGDRSSYFFQALISRKFSDRFSLEVSPGWLTRALTEDPSDSKDLFTIGVAGRFKFSKRMSLVGDYQMVNFSRPDNLTNTYYNPLGVGLEIETGGHVFSLNFMNSEYIIENSYLADTQKSWKHGGVRFGFTISRNFTLHKSKNPDIKSTIY